MPIFRRPAPAPDAADQEGPLRPEVVDTRQASEPQLPPSRMRGTEPLYGYVVGLELLVVAILNVVITKGKGAPTHPQTGLQIIAIVVPLVFIGLLQLRNRTIAGFAAIVAAFFVTLPKVPNALAVAHVFALAIPLAYGLLITQRQRRALGTSMRRGGRRQAGQAGQGGQAGQAQGRGGQTPAKSSTERRRGRKKGQDEPSGPKPNARYTPPKAKRNQPQGKARR